jgi:hypothetical protein
MNSVRASHVFGLSNTLVMPCAPPALQAPAQPAPAQPAPLQISMDAAPPLSQRVDALIGQMTLVEKVAPRRQTISTDAELYLTKPQDSKAPRRILSGHFTLTGSLDVPK